MKKGTKITYTKEGVFGFNKFKLNNGLNMVSSRPITELRRTNV